ncbi:hypothetical protein GQ457_07G012270 [Hibiscus cannabinus]
MGHEVGEDNQSPLLASSSSIQGSAEPVKRTGTLWTTIAHIITGVIGAGVLSLAWSMAQLGWIAGPICIIAFAFVTTVSNYLLCDCYKFPDPEFGPNRTKSYMDAVRVYLGERQHKVCGLLVQESLYGTTVAYPIKLFYQNLSLLFEYLSTMVRRSLELANGVCDNDGHPARTGTVWTCVAHIITAVIGSGVLSLAWSTSQLGWIGGPAALIIFAIITYISSSLLSDCYRSDDGTRNKFYKDAVRLYLGRNRMWICVFLQNLSLYGFDVAYVITTSTCLRAILKSNCYHKEGHNAPCSYGYTIFMLIFGAVQIVMSQIPNFHNMAWLSVIAAAMSFTYSFIGLGLGFAQVKENGTVMGSLTGVPAANLADKLWLIFQSLGDIAFAYPYSIILLEIQDTLKSPPAENKTMKKASVIAILVTTFFYLCCGCAGYAAFGNNTPGNLLTGFGFYEPYWLIDFANACIVAHLLGGYQIFAQPVFAFVEGWFTSKYPTSRFVNDSYTVKLPCLPSFGLSPLRLCFRTAYVISTTVVAMIFPYFNQVLGVLGALNFWPLAIYFPVEMYFIQKKIQPWTGQWVALRTFSFLCFLVTVVGLVGSIEGLIAAKLG